MNTRPLFSGLVAFPLTPLNEDGVDDAAFGTLVERLVDAKVDSIGALGSTGSYVYLSQEERARVARLAIQHAGQTPVMVGISALRTRDVLKNAEAAQRAGAKAVMLSPISYQKLTDDEVLGLYETVCRTLSVPLCVYDNPRTTNFVFSDELHGRIASLPRVGSIKLPGVPVDREVAKKRIETLRNFVPAWVTLGISGDSVAAIGMIAGCTAWYSVIGGLFPKAAVAITRASERGDIDEAVRLSSQLEPVWKLFQLYGSLRVVTAAAAIKGLVAEPNLPLPIRHLSGTAKQAVADALSRSGLTD